METGQALAGGPDAMRVVVFKVVRNTAEVEDLTKTKELEERRLELEERRLELEENSSWSGEVADKYQGTTLRGGISF